MELVAHDPFDVQLAKVEGKIRRVNFSDPLARRRDALLYYFNRAEELHDAAMVIEESKKVLPHAFALLAGLSLELLLKGILRGLQETGNTSHDLVDLSARAGIRLSGDDKIILEALSHYVLWAAKYPAPNNAGQLLNAENAFAKQNRGGGNLADYYIETIEISRENYDRLWELFVTYFFRVHDAVHESVEFDWT
jgi:hypothetical protein